MGHGDDRHRRRRAFPYLAGAWKGGHTLPKLSDLMAEKAKADIPVGGSVVKIEFFVLWRERFSEDEWTAAMAVVGLDHLKLLLPKILLSWDMVDDDGRPIPV